MLPKDVVVHAVQPQINHDDRASVTRRDDATFASLATKHHGLFYDVGGTGAKDLPQAVLELVRPTRIEHFAIDEGALGEAEVDPIADPDPEVVDHPGPAFVAKIVEVASGRPPLAARGGQWSGLRRDERPAAAGDCRRGWPGRP